MSRYDYNESKVNSAKETLENAKSAISNTATDFSTALSQIVTASKGYLEIDTTTLPQIPEEVNSSIDSMVALIAEKQAMIEEYNDSPWYEKLGASFAMGVTKIGEGIATAGETIIDGGATVVGGIGGLFSSDFQDSCAEFIEKDHVGDYFADQYENGGLKWINDKSYFSSTSTAASVFKGVGVATGYVAVAAVTGGGAATLGGTGFGAGATAGINSIGLQAGIAGLGGVGSGTQSGLQSGLSFNEASMQGLKQGAIQAGTVFVAGKVAQNISNKLKGNAGTKSTELSVVDNGNNAANKVASQVDDGINAASKVDDGINAASKTVGKSDTVFESAGTFTGKDGRQWIKIKDAAGKMDMVDPITGETLSNGKIDLSKVSGLGGTPTSQAAATTAEVTIPRLPGAVATPPAQTAATTFGTTMPGLPGAVASNSGGIINGLKNIGMAVATSPVAKGAFVADTVTQSGVEKAKSQARVANATDNIPLNTDLPETLAATKTFENKSENKTEEPLPQIEEQPENTAVVDTPSENTGGTNNGGGDGIPSGNSDNGNTIQYRYTGDTKPILNNSEMPTSAELGLTKPAEDPAKLPIEIPKTPSETPTTPVETPTTPSETPITPSETPTTPSETPTTPVETPSVPIEPTPSNGGQINYPNNNNYTNSGSALGNLNNNPSPTNPGEGLSYENKPGIDLENSATLNGGSTGSTLDVISIDKNPSTVAKTSGGGSNVIPIGLGVAASAAAGVAGVRYIKNRSDSNQEEDEYYDDSENNHSFSYLSNYDDTSENSNDNITTGYHEAIDNSNDNITADYTAPKYRAGTVNKLKLDSGADIKINNDSDIIAPQREELE